MATYTFEKAQVVVEYVAAFDNDGLPIIKKKSFANIRSNATAAELLALTGLFSQLSEYEVIGQQKVEYSQFN